jgi:hypothetical protein
MGMVISVSPGTTTLFVLVPSLSGLLTTLSGRLLLLLIVLT